MIRAGAKVRAAYEESEGQVPQLQKCKRLLVAGSLARPISIL